MRPEDCQHPMQLRYRMLANRGAVNWHCGVCFALMTYAHPITPRVLTEHPDTRPRLGVGSPRQQARDREWES